MRVPRSAVLLGAYPAGVLTRLLLYTADYGWEAWSIAQVTVATVIAILALGLLKREESFAPVAIVAGAMVGTIEVLGNAVSIPESVLYVRDDERVGADPGFYLYSAGALIVLAAGVCALGAAITLAFRYFRTAVIRPLLRPLSVGAAIEATLLACIAYFGLGGFEQSRIQLALLISQFPAVAVLTSMGWCCGVGGGLVFTDAIDPHWGGLTRFGIPILFVTNTGIFALVLLAAQTLVMGAWRLSRSLRSGRQTAP